MSLLSDTADQATTGLEQLQAMLASGRQTAMGNTRRFSAIVFEDGRAVFEGEPSDHV